MRPLAPEVQQETPRSSRSRKSCRSRDFHGRPREANGSHGRPRQAGSYLLVPVVHSRVTDDILLVHAGILAFLTLVGLAPYVVEHVLLKGSERKDCSTSGLPLAPGSETWLSGAHLEGRPTPGAVTALQAAEELWVASLVRVDMEAQVIMGEETGAADPAQVGAHQGLGGLMAVPAVDQTESQCFRASPTYGNSRSKAQPAVSLTCALPACGTSCPGSGGRTGLAGEQLLLVPPGRRGPCSPNPTGSQQAQPSLLPQWVISRRSWQPQGLVWPPEMTPPAPLQLLPNKEKCYSVWRRGPLRQVATSPRGKALGLWASKRSFVAGAAGSKTDSGNLHSPPARWNLRTSAGINSRLRIVEGCERTDATTGISQHLTQEEAWTQQKSRSHLQIGVGNHQEKVLS